MRILVGSAAAVLALAASQAASPVAWAADATPDEAGHIKTALERYFGVGPVTVGAAGPGYRIDFDVKAMLQGLERFGVTLKPATYSLTATPQPDGLFHVVSGNLPEIAAKFGEQTVAVVANGQTFDGTYDPRIPAFTQSTGHYDSISIGVTGPNGVTQTRQLSQGSQTATAKPTGDGVVDARLDQTIGSFKQDLAFSGPNDTPVEVSVQGGRTSASSTMDGLHIRALTNLWAFFVAHPSADGVKAHADDLKAVLRQALPLFGHWSQDGQLDGLNVRSAFGLVAMQQLTTHIDLNGLTADGAVGFRVKADKLVVPTATLPPWSAAVIPTGLELDAGLTGYRLDDAARTLIDEADFRAPQPVSDATIAKLKTLMGPPDKLVVSIGPSRILTPTLDARFSGEVHLTQPIPRFTVTAHATGLDQAIGAIKGKAAQDRTASQAMAMLLLAKGYGKQEANGGLTWVVAGDGSGAITINGVPLPSGGAK